MPTNEALAKRSSASPALTLSPQIGLPVEIQLPLEKLYYWEKNCPDKLYLTQPYGDNKVVEYHWQRVADEVRRVASYLKSLRLEPGTSIGILSKNCAHWILSDLAIWMAGHVTVPLYPTLTADSVNQVLEGSRCKVLFVGKLDDWEFMRVGVPEQVRCLSYPLSPENDFLSWDEILLSNDPMVESPIRGLDEVSTIMYTSGTTGMPKGVVHTFGGMAITASNAALFYGINGEDRMLSFLPLSHVAERVIVELASLYEAVPVYFADSLESFRGDIQRARPTIFFAVPRIWTKLQLGVLADLSEQKLNRLLRVPVFSRWVKRKILLALGLDKARLLLSGAAPLSQNSLEWYKRLGIEILEVYGMTENMAYSHSSRKGDQKVGYVGKSNPGVTTRLSETGEVLVKSPGNMVGYYQDPVKTAEVFTEDHFFKTGDFGFIDNAGNLKITGRVNELFKTEKGKYVLPVPIEDKMLCHDHVEQVCVTGANLSQPICLLNLSLVAQERILKAEYKELLIKELSSLLEQVNSQIEKHERITCLVITKEDWTVGNGCLTPTLKLKRNAIDKKYCDLFETWSASGESVVWE